MRGRLRALGVSGALVTILFVAGLLNPLISYDPVADVRGESHSLLDPSWAFPLGTDFQGRDVAFRCFKAIDAFFFPGLLAALFAISLGGLLGAFIGYRSGLLKRFICFVLELLDTLPRMVFLILLCTIWSSSIPLITAVTGLLFVPSVATLIRRRVETLAAEDHIQAYVAHGFSPPKILCYHILWLQCRALLIRQGFFIFAYLIFVESALSYLDGYGVQEPIPSWGNMIARVSKGEPAMLPWLAPAVILMISIAALMQVGDRIAQRSEEELR